jgi:hypothetical protein
MLEEKLSERVQIFHDNINTNSAIFSSTSSSNFENFTVERTSFNNFTVGFEFDHGIWVQTLKP